MQSYFQHRQIYRQLQKQIVVKNNRPDDVWTSERRYWYRDGAIQSDPRDPDDGPPAERRRTHGHRTLIGGPALEPRHTTRSHLDRDGDVERADYDPDVQVDPYTINSRDTLGGSVDMMLTGVERDRPANERPLVVADGESIIHKDKIIMVTYEGDCDPMDPHNWSFPCKASCTLLLALLGFLVWWSSIIDATAVTSTRVLFHTSFELQTVPTALYLICLGVGSLVTAPISEVVGRNPVYIPTLALFMLFTMGAGLSRTIAQRIVLRAFAGLSASAPLVCSAAAVVDLWTLIERVYVYPFFAMITFLGAAVAPTVGSYITEVEAVSWRFVDWVTIILAGVLLALVVLFLPETYSPVLLQWKARQLRRLTGDDRYRAPLEFKRIAFSRRLGHALYRPFLLLWTEPIIMIFGFYLAIIFIILYTFSRGFVAVFQKPYNISMGKTGLTFLALAVGFLLAVATVPLSMKLVRKDIRRARQRGLPRPEPEFNLYLAMFGAPLIPISLFWMGWSAGPSVSIWGPLAAVAVFGFGILCVLVSSYQYISATFDYHPASALASIQMLRLTAAGVMAIIAKIMYIRLGAPWTMTLLGCIAAAFLPVPYVLYVWGSQVRNWSRYAQKAQG